MLPAILQHEGLEFFLKTLLPIWLVGLLTGLVFPRQGLQQSLGALFLSGAGTVSVGGKSAILSQVMMFINGVMFIQSVWYRCTPAGTAHHLCSRAVAILRLHQVPGIRRLVTSYNKGGFHNDTGADRALDDKQQQLQPQLRDSSGGERAWPVDDSDVDFFKARVRQSKVPQAGPWETMIQKELPGVLKYHSQRRMLNDIKKTEYMTTSLTVDSRPREVMDFFLSDPARQKWDNMLTKAEILENGDFARREMIVHWVRSFPFSFLSDRDYVIGRKEFQEGETIFGITKVVKRPEHSPGKLVQTDNYWSMWSCEPISCPYNTGKPATKTVLLHMEDFKIPENLSRFAVKHGMWGFIKQMTPHMQDFVKERRARGLGPDETDTQAFGSPSAESTIARTVSPVQHKDLRRRPGSAAGQRPGCTTPPPPRRSCSEGALSASSHSSRSKMRRVASAAIAGGMLIALGAAQRPESQANLSRATSVRASKRGSEEDEEALCPLTGAAK